MGKVCSMRRMCSELTLGKVNKMCSVFTASYVSYWHDFFLSVKQEYDFYDKPLITTFFSCS